MSTNNSTTQVCYGTIQSQPVKAAIYYSFEVSTGKTPHDLIVLRSNHGYELTSMRDRVRTFLNKKLANFSSTIIPIREDKLGRGCYYTCVPVYAGRLPASVKSALIYHFNKLEMREWVNTSASPVEMPTRSGKDRVIKVVNAPTYTKSEFLSFTEAINSLLSMDIGTLHHIAKDNGIPVTNNKVVLAKAIATNVKIARPKATTPVETEQDKGIRLLSELALLAMEPEELPAIPLAAVVMEAEVVTEQLALPASIKSIPQQQLEEFVANGRLNNLTKAQLIKLGKANNVVVTNRMTKGHIVKVLAKSVNG